MTRRSFSPIVLLAAVLAACGPGGATPEPTWMVGVYSNYAIEGISRNSVSRAEFFDDGTAKFWSIFPGAGMCGGSTSTVLEYSWEYDGTDAAIIWDHGIDSPVYLRVTQADDDCTELELHYIHHGDDLGSFKLQRGEMCLESINIDCDPDVQCDGCRTAWCSGPPEPCD